MRRYLSDTATGVVLSKDYCNFPIVYPLTIKYKPLKISTLEGTKNFYGYKSQSEGSHYTIGYDKKRLNKYKELNPTKSLSRLDMHILLKLFSKIWYKSNLKNSKDKLLIEFDSTYQLLNFLEWDINDLRNYFRVLTGIKRLFCTFTHIVQHRKEGDLSSTIKIFEDINLKPNGQIIIRFSESWMELHKNKGKIIINPNLPKLLSSEVAFNLHNHLSLWYNKMNLGSGVIKRNIFNLCQRIGLNIQRVPRAHLIFKLKKYLYQLEKQGRKYIIEDIFEDKNFIGFSTEVGRDNLFLRNVIYSELEVRTHNKFRR